MTTALTILSIALSTALLIGVELVRTGGRESFTNTISQTDLIVGARGGSLQLLLYTVFHMGTATNNISYATYERLKHHPAVQWTIPYSLGDSHRGFRVIATTEDFYREYRYRRDRQVQFATGRAPVAAFEVAIGAEVARTLGYHPDQMIVVAHGLVSGKGLPDHKEHPFRIVGILQRTATPIDRALYVTLEGMTAIHAGWQQTPDQRQPQKHPPGTVSQSPPAPEQITAFLLRSRSRIDTLQLQREINTFAEEPLMAIIPGVTLSELWRGIGYVEQTLWIVTILVLTVGLLSMLIALYASLNERRREMAVLRALGASPRRILSLLIIESGFLSIVGIGFGIGFMYGILALCQPVIEQHVGLSLPLRTLTSQELLYLAFVVGSGMSIGAIPAIKAYRNTLVDGLTVRN